MKADLLTNLRVSREELLREYMLARGLEKGKVLTKILELDEQIEVEKKLRIKVNY